MEDSLGTQKHKLSWKAVNDWEWCYVILVGWSNFLENSTTNGKGGISIQTRQQYNCIVKRGFNGFLGLNWVNLLEKWMASWFYLFQVVGSWLSLSILLCLNYLFLTVEGLWLGRFEDLGFRELNSSFDRISVWNVGDTENIRLLEWDF